MKVIVNNLATEYLDEGDGPIILMLHGWWRSLKDFDVITSSHKGKYRIIRLDLPGFAGTEAPNSVWGVKDYVEFVRAFVEKLEVKPYALLGHSFGGRIIIRGVGSGKLSAEKIILISAAGLKTKSWINKAFMMLAKIGDVLTLIPPLIFVRGEIKKKFYKMVRSEYIEAGSMQGIFKAVVDEDLSPFAREIKVPTALIWGEYDHVTPLSQAKTLNKLINSSKLNIIKDAGHNSHTEQSKEVSNIITKFLV